MKFIVSLTKNSNTVRAHEVPLYDVFFHVQSHGCVIAWFGYASGRIKVPSAQQPSADTLYLPVFWY